MKQSRASVFSYTDQFSSIPLKKRSSPPRYSEAERKRTPEILELYRSYSKRDFSVPPAPPSLEDFARFSRDGNRIVYEKGYFLQRRRLTGAALRSWADPEDRQALSQLEETLQALCDESTWALPAHLPGGGMEPGYPHEKELDLFNCETAFALSEILFLLGHRIQTSVAARCRLEINRRVLDSFTASEPGWWSWERAEHNWSAVCGGSLGCTAIYMMEDLQALEPFLLRLMPVMDSYLRGFPSDGASMEGLGYWSYGFYYFTAFADLLNCRSGGMVDLLSHPFCRKIAEFQQKCYLTSHLSVSFSDSEENERYRPGLTSYLSARFDSVTVPPKFCRSNGEDPCARWPQAFRDILWAQPTEEISHSGRLSPGPWYLPQSQWLIAPSFQRGLAFALKGGHNGEPHNHNDLGSFILASGPQQFLCDPGAGEYTDRYFGEGQYGILCKSSRGHNVPLIGEYEQQGGRSFKSLILQVDGLGKNTSSSRKDRENLSSVLESSQERRNSITVRVDLTGAYPAGSLASLEREFRLYPKESRLEMTDFYNGKNRIRERFITPLKPRMEGDAVVLSSGSDEIRVHCGSSGGVTRLYREQHRNHWGKVQPLWIIEYSFEPTPLVQQINFHFKLET